MTDKAKETGEPSRAASLPLEQIRSALAGIRFGSVEIVIHDGKVVQIERKEKVRFNTTST